MTEVAPAPRLDEPEQAPPPAPPALSDEAVSGRLFLRFNAIALAVGILALAAGAAVCAWQ